MSRYTAPQPLTMPDVYTAAYDFIAAYALPALAPENIVRGWQNRNHLPPQTNQYAVVTVLLTSRRGTNVQSFAFDPFSTADGVLTQSELVTCAVQMDFCADDDTARQRAQSMELLARSPLSVEFFAEYGISVLYAEDVKDLSFVDGSKQFVQRFSATVQLSFWASMAASVGWFDHINLYQENVDVHHPK